MYDLPRELLSVLLSKQEILGKLVDATYRWTNEATFDNPLKWSNNQSQPCAGNFCDDHPRTSISKRDFPPKKCRSPLLPDLDFYQNHHLSPILIDNNVNKMINAISNSFISMPKK